MNGSHFPGELLICFILVILYAMGVGVINASRSKEALREAQQAQERLDRQFEVMGKLNQRVDALEALNPAKKQISELPPFPPAKKPERSILIDPNSRIIGGEKTSSNYWGCACQRKPS